MDPIRNLAGIVNCTLSFTVDSQGTRTPPTVLPISDPSNPQHMITIPSGSIADGNTILLTLDVNDLVRGLPYKFESQVGIDLSPPVVTSSDFQTNSIDQFTSRFVAIDWFNNLNSATHEGWYRRKGMRCNSTFVERNTCKYLVSKSLGSKILGFTWR